MSYKLILSRLRHLKPGLWTSVAVLLFGVLQTATASAISQNDLNSIYLNTPFYDQQAEACTDPNGATILVGSDNVTKTFNFLSSKGISKTAVAAIMGNLMVESAGITPTIVQHYGDHPTAFSDSIPLYAQGTAGYGIAQWTNTDRQNGLIAKAANEGFPKDSDGLQFVGDLRLQLDYLWQEATSDTYSKVLTAMKKAAAEPVGSDQTKPLYDATDIWMRGYESPDITPETITARNAAALSVYSQFKDNVPLGGGVCGSTDFVDNFLFYKQCSYAGWVIGGLETQAEKDAAAAWSNKPFGSGTVCSSGCGPTSVAMAILNLTGDKSDTPDKVSAYTFKVGAGDGGGSNGNALIRDVIPHYGLKGGVIDAVGGGTGHDHPGPGDIQEINNRLAQGDLVLMRGHMENEYYQSQSTPYGPFSVDGHFVIIRGLSDGKWLIGNPGGWPDTLKYDPAWVYAHTTVHDSWWIGKE